MHSTPQRHAFTIIEMLLVVSIIGTLAGIVVAAINPTEQLIAAADAERRTTAKELKNAIYQYVIDGGELPDSLPDSSLAAVPICPYNELNDSSCINLDVLVAQDYLTTLPQDVAGANIGTSGYEIYKQDDQVVVTPRLLGYKRSTLVPTINSSSFINISANQSERFAAKGDYVYVCSSLGGGTVRSIDFSDTDNPVLLDTVTNGSELTVVTSCAGILSHGDYLYVLDLASDSLTVIDVTNPAAMAEAGVIVNGGGASQLSDPYDVAVSGNYAFVVSYTSDSLTVFDISDPSAITQVETVLNGVDATELNAPRHIRINGNYAYVISGIDDSLSVFDISNPLALTEVGTVIDGGGASGIDNPSTLAVSGDYAYITSSMENKLSAIDVSDPANPVEASVLTASSSAHIYYNVDIKVVGQYLYTHGSTSGGPGADIIKAISIFSLQDPANPVQIASYSLSIREPNNFMVLDNRAYALNTWTGNLYYYQLW